MVCKRIQSSVLILCICLIVLGITYVYRTPYGVTPEKAINAFLDSRTNYYRLLEETKESSIGSNVIRYVVTVECKYNWLGGHDGRGDGLNIYFFDITKSDKGWYVSSANSGP
ncbi:hypothetical protein Desaci_1966 [Desulfosporosinus acidiphilus SJ4]|uniref:Uncharacterized protein n=1 Tax=Desulfosporosinus acidiphilus (strain DSM 22704 / JCM 16185 / SJ4) TaxID=646529 RepID=I4D569_DESAJ|nr:hypothetical protein [Desulfosporosinus acidiphilus]AFM40943.1 hypothetical protein Desaci_1966 [Desulfosporosinus acidiphilus SJ4]